MTPEELAEYANKTRSQVYEGRCLICGDEWYERTPPIICPECHSLDVISLGAKEFTEADFEERT